MVSVSASIERGWVVVLIAVRGGGTALVWEVPESKVHSPSTSTALGGGFGVGLE